MQRAGALRYMEPPRSAPLPNRSAKGNQTKIGEPVSQIKRGPKNPGRSGFCAPKSVPSTHMRWSTTAILRASATRVFLKPARLASFSPQLRPAELAIVQRGAEGEGGSIMSLYYRHRPSFSVSKGRCSARCQRLAERSQQWKFRLKATRARTLSCPEFRNQTSNKQELQ